MNTSLGEVPGPAFAGWHSGLGSIQGESKMVGLKRLYLVPFLLALAGCSGDQPALVNGETVPSFTLPSLNGGQRVFPADYKDKVVAIRFWADWCPFCKSEMSALEPIYQKYHEQGLEMLAINVRQESHTAQKFVDKIKISYPVLLDEEGATARNYRVIGLPTTFFIDRDGKLHNKILGESTEVIFEGIVKELL
jgi:cytochrome c biogenesis protein CcmG, thiol:disulfide interchange protein DsbE